MRRFVALFVIVTATGLAIVAQNRVAAPKPAATGAAGSTVPTKATVESFLYHAFGWNSQMKIALAGIAPSPAPGVAEVTVDVAAPQGSGQQKLFVTADGKQAIVGAMYSFDGQPGVKPSDNAINAFLRQMTSGKSDVTWSIAQVTPRAVSDLTEVIVVLTTPQGRGSQHFWVTADGKHALAGEIGPFAADPYASTRAELARGMNGAAKGPADAPITIFEFGDLQCPSCKSAQPTIERLMGDEPNVRFVFQQFPLVTIHAWALTASKYADCVARESNPAFWKFADLVYGQQEQITQEVVGSKAPADVTAADLQKAEQKLTALATQAGVDGQQTAKCAAATDTYVRVNHSMELGKSLGVTGTPTLFIAGRKISNLGGMPYEAVKSIVDFQAKTAQVKTARK